MATVTDKILRLLDRRTETRGKDPCAYEKAGRELLELKQAEPVAWKTAMRWIGATAAAFAITLGSGCTMTPPAATTPPGTVRPMAGVRVEWSAGGLAITPYVRAGAFTAAPENGPAPRLESTPHAADLGAPVRVPAVRGCKR